MDNVFPQFSAAGSAAEIGQQIGEHFRKQIREMAGQWLEGVSRDRLQADANELFLRIAPWGETYIMEVDGVAVGAGITFDEALYLQARWPLPASGGCTTFAVWADGVMVAGANHDVSAQSRERTVVFHLKPHDGPQVMTLAYPGSFQLDGMNECGLCLSGNSIYAGGSGDGGLPIHLVKRLLLQQPSVTDCIALAQRLERSGSIGFSGNFTLGDASGGIVCLEFVCGRLELLQPVNVGEAVSYAAHTNHVLSTQDSLRRLETSCPYPSNSRERLERFRERLCAAERIEPDVLQQLLADHEHYPGSICCHIGDEYRTAYSVLMLPDRKEMQIAYGNPCASRYIGYGMAQFSP